MSGAGRVWRYVRDEHLRHLQRPDAAICVAVEALCDEQVLV